MNEQTSTFTEPEAPVAIPAEDQLLDTDGNEVESPSEVEVAEPSEDDVDTDLDPDGDGVEDELENDGDIPDTGEDAPEDE